MKEEKESPHPGMKASLSGVVLAGWARGVAVWARAHPTF